jgi:hypothetical protein
MLERQIDQAERLATLRNDLSVQRQREQGSAYIHHYQQEMGGRWAAAHSWRRC